MEAPPPPPLPLGLLTDGESRGDAGNLIIVERLPTVVLLDIVSVVVIADYCYQYCQVDVYK